MQHPGQDAAVDDTVGKYSVKSGAFFSVAIGAVLLGLGTMVCAGWALRNETLLRIRPDSVGTVLNAAGCLALIGVAFLLDAFKIRWVTIGQTIIGYVVLGVGCITFAETVFNTDLLVDFSSVHDWLDDGSPRPGRIAPNAALGFILSGFVWVAMQKVTSKATGMAIQIATLGVLIIGLTGLVTYSLQLDLIYPWFRAPAMPALTAIGLIVTAIGLSSLSSRARWYTNRRLFKEDERIAFVAIAILIGVALTAGVSGLSSHQASLEQSLRRSLQSSLDDQTTLFQSLVKQSVANVKAAAGRPTLIRLTRVLGDRPGEPTALATLQVIGQSIVESGFRALAVYDRNGGEVLMLGRFAHDPTIQTDLDQLIPSTLLWDGAFFVKSQSPLVENGVQIGSLEVEQLVSLLTERLFVGAGFGETGEMELCLPENDHNLCFPQRRQPKVYRADRIQPSGKSVAGHFAAQGHYGVINGRDYRGNNVIAAHRRLTSGGLGISIKQDTQEMFQPIRDQLRWSIPMLLLMVACGAWLVRHQVTPLVATLVRSEKQAFENELRIRTVVDNVTDGIMTLNERGVIETFNGGAASIFGYPAEEAIGMNVMALIPPEMAPSHEAGLKRYLAGGESRVVGKSRIDVPGLRRDGSTVQIEIAIDEIGVEGRRLFVGILRDITERKQAEVALFNEKERLRVTLSSIGDAVITTDNEGRVVYLNPTAEEMTGWTTDEGKGLPLRTVMHLVTEGSEGAAPSPVDSVLLTGQRAMMAHDTLLIRRDGIAFAIEDSAAPIRGPNDQIIGVVVVFHDVSEARKMAAQMIHQASHDALTGLINRREFERRLELALKGCKADGQHHTLLYLDLDQFKIVNDTYGHVAGDELLRQLTSLLHRQLRQSDTLARLGGDEFGVLLESCPPEPALRIAEALRQTVSDFRFVWLDQAFPIGVSIGLVTFSDGTATLADVLRTADSACYMAKEKGRNRVHVYTPHDKELMQRHGEMRWVSLIHKALEEDRFVLYSQKILALPANAEAGDHYELLLRLMAEDGTAIAPMAFIPAAERYGLMPLIDRWVVKTALAQHRIRHLPGSAPGTCAINLSGASICDPGFSRFVCEQFDRHAVAPQAICFEVTETAAVANLTEAAAFIRELRSMGCRFALDDFGSGMSSFAYLKNLPVDYLKIDGGFVKDMISDPIDYAMVQAINNIGHTMGIQTVAEFVESPAIIDALRALGVDFGQGYAIEAPKPP